MAKLPTMEELATLKKSQITAYAARNAMRALAFCESGLSPDDLGRIKEIVKEVYNFVFRKGTKLELGFYDRLISISNKYLEFPSVQAAVMAISDAVLTCLADSPADSASSGPKNLMDALSESSKIGSIDVIKEYFATIARSEFSEIEQSSDELFDVGPRGSFGPVWPNWHPIDWDESKLDFLYENGEIEPDSSEDSSKQDSGIYDRKGICLELKIPPGASKEQVKQILIEQVDELDTIYRRMGGSGLVIDQLEVLEHAFVGGPGNGTHNQIIVKTGKQQRQPSTYRRPKCIGGEGDKGISTRGSF